MRGGEKGKERKRGESACVRACVLRAYASRRESVIDLFREEAGISGLREGSVEEREGDKEREESRGEREEISRVGGEKERERDTVKRRRTGRYHTCARALADPDWPMVNARMTACSYVLFGRPAPRRRERKREQSAAVVSR